MNSTNGKAWCIEVDGAATAAAAANSNKNWHWSLWLAIVGLQYKSVFKFNISTDRLTATTGTFLGNDLPYPKRKSVTAERDFDKLSLPGLQNIDDLEKQNQNPANNAGTSSKCALFYLRLRRVALLIIESDISLETLKALGYEIRANILHNYFKYTTIYLR